jgi:hypothetical protein
VLPGGSRGANQAKIIWRTGRKSDLSSATDVTIEFKHGETIKGIIDTAIGIKRAVMGGVTFIIGLDGQSSDRTRSLVQA